MEPRRSATVAALLALTLLALLLRLPGLARESLWTDEAWTAYYASGSPGSVFTRLIAEDNHPPLYHLVTWPVARLSDSETALRLPSVLFGTLAVPALFLALRRAAGARPALLAAALLALSPFATHYSREARFYALVLILSAAALALTLALRQRPRTGTAAALGLVNALLLHTQYVTAFFVAALLLLAFAAGRRARGPAVLSGAATAALCLPWLLAARSHFTTVLASYWVPPLDLSTVLSGTAGIAALGAYPGAWPWAPGAAAAAPWAALLAVSAVRARHSPEARAGLFLVLFPLALDLLVSLRRPLFLPRTLIYLLPPLLWLAAEAVRGRGRAAGAAWAGILLASLVPGAVLVHARDYREDWRGAVAAVAAGVRPGEVVLVDSFLRRGYDYYAARHPALEGVPVVEIPRWEAVPDLAAFLTAARGAAPRTCWLLTRVCEEDEAKTRAAAAARFRVLSARERNSVAADHLELR